MFTSRAVVERLLFLVVALCLDLGMQFVTGNGRAVVWLFFLPAVVERIFVFTRALRLD